MKERVIYLYSTPAKEVYKPDGSDWLDIATAFCMGGIVALSWVLWMLGKLP